MLGGVAGSGGCELGGGAAGWGGGVMGGAITVAVDTSKPTVGISTCNALFTDSALSALLMSSVEKGDAVTVELAARKVKVDDSTLSPAVALSAPASSVDTSTLLFVLAVCSNSPAVTRLKPTTP